ncbi:MAG: DUF1634 domain-containing protein [Candidatus Bathyarchaeia archaeon]|jgi:uncharacterized membrane protein
MKRRWNEEGLERAISYVLITGVLASVAVETFGIVSYYLSNGNLNILFQPNSAMKGTDFFSYTAKLAQQLSVGALTPMQVLGLGIVLLMMTPYLRVVASVVYFGLAKNPKYLLITLFVLIVLTATLLKH